MIRVTGIIKSPIDEPIEYTSLLLQTINGSLEVLPNSYAHIELDETGEYDFNVLNGSYRVYANYENSMKVHILGEFTASDGMNDPSYTLNQLVSNFSPQAPDWAVDLDNKWQDLFDDLIGDANTRFNTINQAITDGDAQVISDMTTLVNEELQAQAAIFTEQVSAGNAQVLNQAKAYTDAAGNEIANNITQVSNSVSTVSQQLTAYKDETDNSISAITSRIDTNEANLISEISAEVNAQTGEMELRIENSIGTEVANISEQISVVQDDLDNQKAAWQVVATVDDLTSSIGMTNDGTNSIIYMQAESLVLTNDNSNIGSQTAPFVVEGGVAYINNAVIKELKGNNISTTATIIAGAGNTQAGLNGLDSGIYNSWRIWAGNANPSAAPFRVNSDGKLWATNAVVSGAITATSGSFTGSIYANQGTLNNVTINQNCNILGTLNAQQIVGDITSARVYGVSAKSSNSVSTGGTYTLYSPNLVAINVSQPRPWNRTLLVSFEVATYYTYSLDSEGHSNLSGTLYGQIHGSYGVQNLASSNRFNGSFTAYVDIPANTTGVVYVRAMGVYYWDLQNGHGSLGCTVRAQGNTSQLGVFLLSNNSDLG